MSEQCTFATQTAGTVISFVSGMANTMVYDPVVEQQSAIVGWFYGICGYTLLLFVTNMHHLLIEAMVESYMLFQPGIISKLRGYDTDDGAADLGHIYSWGSAFISILSLFH